MKQESKPYCASHSIAFDVIRRPDSVHRLDAESLGLFNTVVMAFSTSGECPSQSLTSPVTRNGSWER